MINESNPVFVKIDKYKEILEIIGVIEKKMDGARDLLADIEELKQREDEELASWHGSLEEINHKLDVIKDELHE
ncbi:hypothetical protein JW711_05965 [Candidatus Woesearchaeota archaeon]|nr:hypothetical protein [Candidatus Woesearchaeota archaeon]